MIIERASKRTITRLGKTGEAIVVKFDSPNLTRRHDALVSAGATHDYDSYTPHVTLTYDPDEKININSLPEFSLDLVFGREIAKPIKDFDNNKEEIPDSLYLHRRLLNANEVEAWCRDNGIKPQDDMHVTLIYSKVDPGLPLETDPIYNRGNWRT